MTDNRDRAREPELIRRDRRIPARILRPRARTATRNEGIPRVEVHEMNGRRFVAIRTSRTLLTVLTEESALELTNRIVDALETA